MPIWIPNIHSGGSPRKIMTYFHLSACLWWAISILHPAASGKNPEQCGEVGWNKYSSVFYFSQTSPKVTRLMAGQWSGHLQKTSWIYEVTFRPSTTLSFKKKYWKKYETQTLALYSHGFSYFSRCKKIHSQNHAELSQFTSIRFHSFTSVAFSDSAFFKANSRSTTFSNYLFKDWCKLEMEGLPVAPDDRGWLLEWTHTLLYKESINRKLKDCHKQTSFKQS